MSTGTTGSTGPAPVFPCVPEFGSSLPPILRSTVRDIKCGNPNGNQLYSLAYAGIQVGNYLTDGLFNGLTGFTGFTGVTGSISLDDAISRTETWFVRIAIFLILPWLLIFIALFIYLAITGTMSIFAALIFIVMVLVLAGFALFFVLWDAQQTARRVYNDLGFAATSVVTDIKNRIQIARDRFNTYEFEISDYLIRSYRLAESCNPSEQTSCCGFNAPDYGCTWKFIPAPDIILTNSTGTIRFSIGTTQVGTGGSYIVIPPELNGGTGTNVPITNPSETTFNYTTGPQESTVIVSLVVSNPGRQNFALNTFVVIVTPPVATDFPAIEMEQIEEDNSEFSKDTKDSLIQLQQALQNTQQLQNDLQSRLDKINENNQRRTRKLGCVGCQNNR